jgi:hypothetical protein
MCRKAEHNLVVRYKNITFIARVHLVGMNVGGAATTIAMIFVGLAGPGIRGVITGENDFYSQTPQSWTYSSLQLPYLQGC